MVYSSEVLPTGMRLKIRDLIMSEQQRVGKEGIRNQEKQSVEYQNPIFEKDMDLNPCVILGEVHLS